jgi:hypothetical protein
MRKRVPPPLITARPELEQQRLALGLTKKGLANMSGIHEITLYKIQQYGSATSLKTARSITDTINDHRAKRRMAVLQPEALFVFGERREPRVYPKADISLRWAYGKLGLEAQDAPSNPNVLEQYASGVSAVVDNAIELMGNSNVHPSIVALAKLYAEELASSDRNIFKLDSIVRIFRSYFTRLKSDFSEFEYASFRELLLAHERMCLLFPDFVQFKSDYDQIKLKGHLSRSDLDEIRQIISGREGMEIISHEVPQAVLRDEAHEIRQEINDPTSKIPQGERRLQNYKATARVLELWNKLIRAPNEVKEKIEAWQFLVEKLWAVVRAIINSVSTTS